MNTETDKFLSENGFERDASRPKLGNIITSLLAKKIMGYEQMDDYFPAVLLDGGLFNTTYLVEYGSFIRKPYCV